VLKNLDHLFEMPHMTAAQDGEYFNIYPNKCFFNAGCMVIKPSLTEYDNILSFLPKVIDKKLYNQDNMLFAD